MNAVPNQNQLVCHWPDQFGACRDLAHPPPAYIHVPRHDNFPILHDTLDISDTSSIEGDCLLAQVIRKRRQLFREVRFPSLFFCKNHRLFHRPIAYFYLPSCLGYSLLHHWSDTSCHWNHSTSCLYGISK